MDRLEKSKTSFVLFILLIIGLLVGGSYLIKNIGKEEEVKEEEKSIKIDDTKEYVYNESNECLSVLVPICYPKIKINIATDDARNIEEKLNADMDALDRSYTKISDIDTSDLELVYHDDDIFKAKVINYKYYTSAYIFSIAVSSYTYVATADFEDISNASYNFDLKTGKLLDNDEVLKLYDLDEDDIIERINNNSNNVSTLDSYNIIVDESNNLIVNYVATSDGVSYNSSITIYR